MSERIDALGRGQRGRPSAVAGPGQALDRRARPGRQRGLRERHGATSSGRTGAGNRYPQPYAVGQSASSLGVSSAAAASARAWNTPAPRTSRPAPGTRPATHRAAITRSSRAPWRASSDRALTALGSYQEASSSNQDLEALGRAVTLRLGLAYRDPLQDKVNVLLRYDYRRNPSTIPDTILHRQRDRVAGAAVRRGGHLRAAVAVGILRQAGPAGQRHVPGRGLRGQQPD